MKRIFLVSALTAGLLAGCSKVQAPGATKTVPMANEWWVTLKIGNDDLLGTHVLFSTYNTSANDDSLWLDDLENGYQFKCKVNTDLKSGTFSTSGSPNEYYDISVTIANGKIIHGGGLSKTGVITDSIYMEAQFSDDPANTYIISGSARTRWADDDY